MGTDEVGGFFLGHLQNTALSSEDARKGTIVFTIPSCTHMRMCAAKGA